MHGTPLRRDDVLSALAAMCQLHRIPFDADLVSRSLPADHSVASIVDASNDLGLRTRATDLSTSELVSLEVPCIVGCDIDAGPAEAGAGPGVNPAAPIDARGKAGDEPPAALALVLRVERDTLWIATRLHPEPRSIPLETFASGFRGWGLQFGVASRPPNDPGLEPARTAGFGFRWFVPELARCKAIWRDVLAAWFAIQLLALATPLFTQVIIDRVVVHQTVNTRAVIGLGLVVAMLFSAALAWVRQYLVIHTGNRVDAVLGTRVLGHLLALPPRYFERRPTGTIVARVHGVETIREFVSGAAVALLLDLPFMAVFLAIMLYYSWLLSLIAVAILGTLVAISIAIVPAIRSRLNQQFLHGARNQAFLTEYVAGMETVKSRQMEPQLRARYGDLLAAYLEASFRTRQLSNFSDSPFETVLVSKQASEPDSSPTATRSWRMRSSDCSRSSCSASAPGSSCRTRASPSVCWSPSRCSPVDWPRRC